MRKSKSRVTKARAICPIRALSIQSIGKTKIRFQNAETWGLGFSNEEFVRYVPKSTEVVSTE